jgi:hypothetical protein
MEDDLPLTGRRDENNRDYIRWCFADAEMAKAFAAEFNQVRLIQLAAKSVPNHRPLSSKLTACSGKRSRATAEKTVAAHSPATIGC